MNVIDLLIVGGDSSLGRPMAAALRSTGFGVHATTRRPERAGSGRPFLELDGGWDTLSSSSYRVAVLLAAVTRLQACKADPACSARINVERTVALARWLSLRGTRVILVSSSLVFDGSRPLRRGEETPSPTTEYGKQKALAETGVLSLPAASVLRVTKVLHPGMPLFDGWLAELAAGRPIYAFADAGVAPVPVDAVVSSIAELTRREGGRGIWQLSATHDISYHAAATHLARAVGASPELVRPALGAETLVEPPAAHTSLDSSRLERELGVTAPDPVDVVLRVFVPHARP